MQPAQLPLALPFLGLWLAAPWIAWWISQPIAPPAPDLTAEQLVFLRRIARKTWHFFETFVTAQENWLPPDNFQEDPFTASASRTSPTNMGLALLANLAARDFGYLSSGRLIERTEASFATMQRLERHRGHFYNWYETRTLKPLLPLYVSSVDSGNLAGHLLTLGAGLRELADERIFDPQIFAGLRDTVGILRSLARRKRGAGASSTQSWRRRPPVCAQRAPLLERAVQQAEQDRRGPGEQRGGSERPGLQILQRSCAEHLEELRLSRALGCRARISRLSALRTSCPKNSLSSIALPPCAKSRPWSKRSVRNSTDRSSLLHGRICLREASARARERVLTLENAGPPMRGTGRDGFHLLVRSGARSVLHRVQRHRTPA